ncbi:hypothetical protein DR864_02575 [Runella rosea]|uniref:DUF3696 domain-containing protein n=1 Tax=Runella rosea TaxID=2259595 RepID=A0A344TDH1_9BACT|nr:DUF3696 domain-containing protein [Runella rosea]AXE16692.1 hypothetical protein DR864_02575 [Runella rosea]
MLTDLRLFQFKKFKDESIELFPLTLLTGINGMGKSSVIQALLVLRQSFDRGELQNNRNLVIEDKELTNLISPDDMLNADAESTDVSITIEDDNIGSATWKVRAEGKSNTLPLVDNVQNEMYVISLFSTTFQYLKAERIGPRATYDRLTVTRRHSPIGYSGEFVANRILEAANQLEEVQLEKVKIEGQSSKVYDLLSYWMSEILYPDSKVVLGSSDASKIDLEYTFKNQPTKKFNPLNIGFGFSYVLPVILAILTSKPGSLLLVENPEAHLHPRGQSRMGHLLALAAESGLQIIVETHSDHLLNGIRVAIKQKKLGSNKTQIHFFTEEFKDTNKQSFAIEEDGSLERWPKGFFDEWDNMLTELLKDS